MLIKRHLLRAARQMHTYGELRPGYLEHDGANHTGPARRSGIGLVSPLPAAPRGSGTVTVSMKVVEDPVTGELLVVQE